MDINDFLNASIKEITSPPSFNKKWASSLRLDLDKQILNRKIIAYKIRWFNGKWSHWFMPGENDVYQKRGEPNRRYWACFYDHTHKYLYHSAMTEAKQEAQKVENQKPYESL